MKREGGARLSSLLNRTLAGYVHLHWGGSPAAARWFVRAMGGM